MIAFSELLQLPVEELRRRSLRPVKVAVLDTGIDSTHPALAGRIARATGYNSANGAIYPVKLPKTGNNDPSGHGTGVAAIIAAIAPNAVISDYRVLAAGAGGFAQTVLRGLADAVDSDADIINASLAFSKEPYLSEAVKLLEKAYRKGKIVIAARRNIPRPGDLGLPAELAAAIGVDMADFPTAWQFRFKKNSAIELTARGAAVLTAHTGGGYVRVTGTSFAAAVVSALCALWRGARKDLQLFELKTLLKHHSGRRPASADPLENRGSGNGELGTGNGAVDLVCKACGAKMTVPDAFKIAACPACGAVARRRSLLDAALYHAIIEEIRATVPEKFCYHDYRHTADVVQAVYGMIARHPELKFREKRSLLLAALVHDIGYAVSPENHEAYGAAFARETALANGYTPAEAELAAHLVLATKLDFEPVDLCEKIIRAADVSHIGTPRAKEKARLLRRELANCGIVFTDAAWRRENAKFTAKIVGLSDFKIV